MKTVCSTNRTLGVDEAAFGTLDDLRYETSRAGVADQVTLGVGPEGVAPDDAEVTYRADNDIAVDGETAQQVVKLLDWLEDLDDVQNVYSNAEISDADLERLSQRGHRSGSRA